MRIVFTLALASVLMLQSCTKSSTDLGRNVYADDIEEEIIPMASQSNVAFRKNATFSNNNDIANQVANIEKKIIRNGQMEIEVADIATAKNTIDSLVAAFEGYYSSENYSNRWDERYDLCIRIPSGKFDAFLATIENGDGKVINKNISADDVTEQFVDIETRLENKRKYIEQYKVLLKRAQKVSEIASISDQIRNIEEEIESITGRLKYLNNQVNFSTLHLNITAKETDDNDDTIFLSMLREAFADGSMFFANSILFIARHWQAIITIGLLTTLALYIRRRRKANK